MGVMFSEEEFNIMTEQLLNEKCVSFDMLCVIAEKTLRSTVIHWCASDEMLRGKKYEDDIMQEIYIRLIKTCKSSFLLRNGIDGPVNNDPNGFKSWIFKVALNVKRDFSESIRKINGNTRNFDDGEEKNIADDSDNLIEITDSQKELLSAAFSIVINSDSGVYKILTWIAQCLFILEADVTKIKSNELIIKSFEDKTLGEMYKMITAASEKIPWITLSDEQKNRINNRLTERDKDDRIFADIRYREFFMKKGGKATVSDWVNRMNSLVKRVINNEASDS